MYLGGPNISLQSLSEESSSSQYYQTHSHTSFRLTLQAKDDIQILYLFAYIFGSLKLGFFTNMLVWKFSFTDQRRDADFILVGKFETMFSILRPKRMFDI